MDLVAPIQRKVVASEIAPDQLAGNTQLSKHEKIAEAGRQFEAVLLRQILENSQKTVIKSKYAPNSTSTSIYRDQVTAQMADSISKAGTFGFAKTFSQQLDRPVGAESNANVAQTFLSAGSRDIPVPRSSKLAAGKPPEPAGWKARATTAFASPASVPSAHSISHPTPARDQRGHPTFKTP